MRNSIVLGVLVGMLAIPASGASAEQSKPASKAATSDIKIPKPIDKSSPLVMADEVRNICSKNPKCRVVRDDSQLTAYCVGDDCVAARKAGKGQQEYFVVKMSDLTTSSFGAATGRRIPWNSVANMLSVQPSNETTARTKSTLGSSLATGKHIPKAELTVRSSTDGSKTLPPANLLENSQTAAPVGSASALGRARNKGTGDGATVPVAPGGGPTVK
ncbi:MAG TPA: hypothetical protein VK877_00255 [Pseudolabrys sp.]|nr:hypothetical protein [Pseudolabrys sp.]